MPRKKNYIRRTTKRTTKKYTKRKTCRRTKQVTGSMAVALSIGSALLDKIPWLVDKIQGTGKDILGMCISLAGLVAPPLWKSIKYLSNTGFDAFKNLVVGMWKDSHKKTVDTKPIKKLLNDIMKKLTLIYPDFKNDPIYYDIVEINKLCFYIDSMNQEGMNQIMFENMRDRVTESIKNLCMEFGKIMKAHQGELIKEERQPNEY